MRAPTFTLILLAAIRLAFAPAMAANLVVDGGFEGDAAGNYSAPSYPFPLGPSTFGPGGVWNVDSGFVGIDGFAVEAHLGSNSLDLAPGTLQPTDLTQTLSTVAGERYDLDFFVAARGPNTFSLRFGGMPVAGAPTSFPSTIPMSASDFSGDYLEYSFLVDATTSQSVLEFGGTSTDVVGMGPDVVLIDDISVTPAAASVPEPAALPLLGTGLVGLALICLRRRHRTC